MVELWGDWLYHVDVPECALALPLGDMGYIYHVYHFNLGGGILLLSVRTPTQCHIDLACNTSYHFAASRTVFPRVSPYLCLGPFAPFGTRI